ncbi:MAG: hypothetical protein S0880_30540 [Actinomycetota bacterium]|nr:hypothetical protein [Actinomycetota bacterium]
MSPTPGDTAFDDTADLEAELRAMLARRAEDVQASQLDPDALFVGDKVVQLVPLDVPGPPGTARRIGRFSVAAAVLVAVVAGWALLGGLDRADLDGRDVASEPPVIGNGGVPIPGEAVAEPNPDLAAPDVAPQAPVWPPPELISELGEMTMDDRPAAPSEVDDLDDLATWLPAGFDAATAAPIDRVDAAEPIQAAFQYLIASSGFEGEVVEQLGVDGVTVLRWRTEADEVGEGWVLLRADDTGSAIVASLNTATELSSMTIGPSEITGYSLIWSLRDGRMNLEELGGRASSEWSWSGGRPSTVPDRPHANFIPQEGIGPARLRIELRGDPAVPPVELILDPVGEGPG